MPKLRCDAIVIQVIATQVDDEGRPIGELIAPATKLFHAKTPDVWAEVHKAIAALEKQQDNQP